MPAMTLDLPLDAATLAQIAEGATLAVGTQATNRIAQARDLVEAIIAQAIPAYGINTGVGALYDRPVGPDALRALSRKLILSHACGVGDPLPRAEVRAIIAAQANNMAHGRSGVRPVLVEALCALLAHDIVPEVPARGSVGYLTHMAHIGLVLIGEGHARHHDQRMTGAEALAAAGLAPLVLEAKEGLSLINGAPCATGLGALALARGLRAVEAADAIAALVHAVLGGNRANWATDLMALRASPGIATSAAALARWLDGQPGSDRLQDPISLRAVPQVHGGVRDALGAARAAIDAELASVTDNPVVLGTPEQPRAGSQAHALAAGLAMALDALGIAIAHLGVIAERRLDRMVNPLVSGLPPFLADEARASSGFMIAQYTAAALVGENRRLAAPASLDGGITSGLQEDYLSHQTAAATKALAIVANVETVLGIELAAAVQAAALRPPVAPALARLCATVRAQIAPYADDRPMHTVIAAATALVRSGAVSAAAAPDR